MNTTIGMVAFVSLATMAMLSGCAGTDGDTQLGESPATHSSALSANDGNDSKPVPRSVRTVRENADGASPEAMDTPADGVTPEQLTANGERGVARGINAPATSADVASTVADGPYCNGTSGCVTLNISFSNRSATVKGTVFDDKNAGSTTALFWFYQGLDNHLTDSDTTRTARNETLPIHFTEPGPVGGINRVGVNLINNATGDRTFIGWWDKP